MSETLYRRPLPTDMIAFSSTDGRRLFAEALATGGLDGYFPLAEQFHTQSDPSFCGLGSLVVALNALGIDPGRLWKGPWRWFAEELLDCCVELAEVRRRGLAIHELACLARCNGADVALQHADGTDLASFRTALSAAAEGSTVLIASYDRAGVGQTGSGHFSPIGGYHKESDLALVLDVARFKYPPHWVSAERLYQAMQPPDPATGRSRGWLTLRRREQGIALGFSVTCDGESWAGLAELMSSARTQLESAMDPAALVRAIAPLVPRLELRTPSSAAHEEALKAALVALRDLPIHRRAAETLGSSLADAATLLLLAFDDLLTEKQRAQLASKTTHPGQSALTAEVNNVRAQLLAVWAHARQEVGGVAAGG